MRVSEFISTKDSRWTDLLVRYPYDIYQMPQYTEFTSRYEGGEPLAFYAETNGSRCLIPLLVRPIPLGEPGWFDAASPYGYPGVMSTSGLTAEDLTAVLHAFKEACNERRIVSAFLRLHPLQPLPLDAFDEHGVLVDHGQTVFVDLTKPAEDIWHGFRRCHRKDIKKLGTLGFQTAIDQWDRLDEVASIYRSTMKRVGAAPWYMFANTYFQELKTSLGGSVHLCTVTSPDGVLAAAGVFTFVNDIAEGHLSGSAEEFRALSPAKLKTEATLRWLRDKGCRRFHFGGGVGGHKDSLFEFKCGFSNDRATFRTFRMIIDKAKYAELTGEEPADDYFPAYRAQRLQKTISKLEGAVLMSTEEPECVKECA